MSSVYENLSLFSDYFLSERLPVNDLWEVDVSDPFSELLEIYEREKAGLDTANESQTEDDFIKPVLEEVLGWHLDSQWETKKQGRRQVPDFALFESKKVLQDAKALRDDDVAFESRVDAVAEAKYWGRSLDVRADDEREEWTNRNPSFQITSYMQTTHRDWGILTNGQTWRLYYAHVRSKVETYYEVDLLRILEDDDREEAQRQFKWFYLFFRAAAHRSTLPNGNSFLRAVYEESETYAAQLEDRLKNLVFDDIFPTLAEGFLAGAHEHECSPGKLDELYRGTLRLLYRLLFLLHAEARGLLPVDESAYRGYSLYEIKKDVAERVDEKRALSPVSTDIWNDLKGLFAIIDRGDPTLNVPRYNGGLFSSKTPANDFFDEFEIADSYLVPALDKLARTDDERTGSRKFVDYKALDVEQLGSIYEGLLEFRLEFEDDQLILINDRGERHVTGSFYTPHYVVEYIVEETLRPLFEQRRDKFEEAMERLEHWESKGSSYQHKISRAENDAIDALLDLQVCDPAMGSGHFLVEAVDWLTRHFIEVLNEYPDNPVLDLIDSIRVDIIGSLEKQGVDIDRTLLKDINLLKRLVMKRCIFGVDLNPMAVELSKLSLWLDSFTVGAPLSFLDHHLRVGNSLVGAWVDEVTEELRRDLFGSAFSGMLTATQFLAEVAAKTDATIEEVEHSVAKFREYQKAMKPYKVLLDCAIGEHFGIPESHALLVEQGPKIRNVVKARQRDDRNAGGELDERETGILSRVDEARRQTRFFHWELEFPEVFFDLEKSTWQEDAGFDAIIGNPPYVRMEQFKALKDFLRNDYAVHADRMDLYGYFIERGLDLLADGGQKGFIVSNKWLRANYGEPIRQLLPRRASVRRLVDFRDLPVFPDASTYPLIIVMSNGVDDDIEGRAVVMDDLDFDSLQETVDAEGAVFTQEHLRTAGWALVGNPGFSLLSRLEREHPPLVEYIGSSTLMGIKSGRNEAFVIDSSTREELIDADPKSAEIIYPLRTGRDVRRYWMRDADTFLIYTFHGVDIDRYPAIEEHLRPYREALEGRATEQAWYELQQPQEAYRELFEEPKIVQPDFADNVRFHIDREGYFVRSTVNFLPAEDWYLLAVLNSNFANFFLKSISALYRGETMRLKGQYVEEMPVPELDKLTSDDECQHHFDSWMSRYANVIEVYEASRGVLSNFSSCELLDSIERHLSVSSSRSSVVRDILAELAEEMTRLHDRRRHFNLNPIPYFGERTDGQILADIGTFHPSTDKGVLDETTETRDKLRIGSVSLKRTDAVVEIQATARYKPDDPEEYDTDTHGYIEVGPFSAFRLTGLTDEMADLVEIFVPAAADRANGFADFRENATKNISLLDRLKELRLPRLSRVADELRRYIETRDEALAIDRRIELTDYLIDQIVYRLYELTDREIEIVEGNEPQVSEGEQTTVDETSDESVAELVEA